MKISVTRRALATALTLLTLLGTLTLSVLPASANSAQRFFEGTTASGTVVRGERSPIAVKHEQLTFRLNCFPPDYYYADSAEVVAEYDASVTASYTLYNPSDMTVTTQLLFPFGVRPSYLASEAIDAMSHKYGITLDGAAVEYTVRHTYKPLYNEQFELATDLARLRDSYTSDNFFRPDMTVTAYTWRVTGLDDGSDAVNIAFDLPKNASGIRILWPEQSGVHTQSDGDLRLSAWAQQLDTFTLYVIGGELDTLPSWKCYQNGGCRDSETVPGSAALVERTTMTLLELILNTDVTGVRPDGSAVSDVDWYNATIDMLSASFNYGATDSSPISSQLLSNRLFANSLMCWYEYSITLEPGQTAVNEVTAPMYPAIDEGYTPPTYTYSYLLSPASTWSSFGTLDVTIETPYYLLDTEPHVSTDTDATLPFTKTDTGYSVSFSSLPDRELTFTLSADPAPEYTYNSGYAKLVAVIILGIVLAVLLVLAVITGLVLLIVFLVKRIKRK